MLEPLAFPTRNYSEAHTWPYDGCGRITPPDLLRLWSSDSSVAGGLLSVTSCELVLRPGIEPRSAAYQAAALPLCYQSMAETPSFELDALRHNRISSPLQHLAACRLQSGGAWRIRTPNLAVPTGFQDQSTSITSGALHSVLVPSERFELVTFTRSKRVASTVGLTGQAVCSECIVQNLR